jgi:hypothetical protein
VLVLLGGSLFLTSLFLLRRFITTITVVARKKITEDEPIVHAKANGY